MKNTKYITESTHDKDCWTSKRGTISDGRVILFLKSDKKTINV